MSRIEDEVCKKILGRAAVGLEQIWGDTMERTDFSKKDLAHIFTRRTHGCSCLHTAFD
jgi:hypothetical protein